MEKTEIMERVFDTLNGFLEQNACVDGVENLFSQNHDCDKLYTEAVQARSRLAARTGLNEDDPDIEGIIAPLLEISRVIGYNMYIYGAKLGNEDRSTPAD